MRPTYASKTMTGLLASHGLRISQQRIGESLSRLNPGYQHAHRATIATLWDDNRRANWYSLTNVPFKCIQRENVCVLSRFIVGSKLSSSESKTIGHFLSLPITANSLRQGNLPESQPYRRKGNKIINGFPNRHSSNARI